MEQFSGDFRLRAISIWGATTAGLATGAGFCFVAPTINAMLDAQTRAATYFAMREKAGL